MSRCHHVRLPVRATRLHIPVVFKRQSEDWTSCTPETSWSTTSWSTGSPTASPRPAGSTLRPWTWGISIWEFLREYSWFCFIFFWYWMFPVKTSFRLLITDYLIFFRIPTPVPTWTIHATDEILYQSPTLLRLKFKNLLNSTVLDTGGHFLALEKPDVFADDVLNAIQEFRRWHRQNKKNKYEFWYLILGTCCTKWCQLKYFCFVIPTVCLSHIFEPY